MINNRAAYPVIKGKPVYESLSDEDVSKNFHVDIGGIAVHCHSGADSPLRAGHTDFCQDIALREIRKSTGWTSPWSRCASRFPMRLSLDRATVVEADGDTMLRAGNIRFSVAMLPLLKGDIQVTGAHLTDIFYRTGAPDSTIWLKADIRDFDLDGAAMNLGKGTIDVDRAVLDGGKVSLMINDSVPSSSPADTSASRPLIIRALDISLLNVDYRMTMMPVIDSLRSHHPRRQASQQARRYGHTHHHRPKSCSRLTRRGLHHTLGRISQDTWHNDHRRHPTGKYFCISRLAPLDHNRRPHHAQRTSGTIRTAQCQAFAGV